jgi:hypothetical protein
MSTVFYHKTVRSFTLSRTGRDFLDWWRIREFGNMGEGEIYKHINLYEIKDVGILGPKEIFFG